MTNRKRSFTNAQAAQYLNVDKSTLYRWRKRGHLLPYRRDRDGAYWYDLLTLELFKEKQLKHKRARDHQGQREALAYKLFREGVDTREIVERLQMPRATVERMKGEYESPGGMHLPGTVRQAISDSLLRIQLHAQSPAELAAIVERIVTENLTLTRQVGLLRSTAATTP